MTIPMNITDPMMIRTIERVLRESLSEFLLLMLSVVVVLFDVSLVLFVTVVVLVWEVLFVVVVISVTRILILTLKASAALVLVVFKVLLGPPKVPTKLRLEFEL